jgi:hypothetical protein
VEGGEGGIWRQCLLIDTADGGRKVWTTTPTTTTTTTTATTTTTNMQRKGD